VIHTRWYDEVKEITERLVRINSISPSVAGENACAAAITRALEEQGLTPGYWKTSGDERKNVWTMLEGSAVPPDAIKIPTVILIGHHDVAGVQDFSSDEDPFDPPALEQALFEQYRKNPDTEDELLLDAGSQEWMFGRGSFDVRGCETHVGEAFRGLDANLIASNLIQETNLNVELCDEADGEITVPAVTQKQRDFKARYDAQTPISAVVHCSVLTHGRTPQDILARMVALAGRALSSANQT
jgi:arginine utilization protein RocB